VSARLGGRAASLLVGLATAVLIVTAAITPLLTPPWVAFEQDRAQATAWTGWSQAELRSATDAILADLVLGPPDFDVAVTGQPVLNERERGHMRDVRTVFLSLWVLAALSLVVVAIAFARAGDRRSLWRAVDLAARILAVAVVALGAVALVAFETLFAVFHRLLFPGGSYTFDPSTERLVQLFPFAFWQETAIVAAVVIVVIAALVAWTAGRRSVDTPGQAAAAHGVTVAGAPR
jgi:integral membrane protein (TIGR01906 family)